MAAFGEKEKLEKQKTTQQVKHIPKDAQVIMSILKELGIVEYEPRVINQLLEFSYRYVTCILDDAKVYANHGKKKAIDLEDVKLASQMLLDRAFTTPPPRDVLFELARSKNNTPLPLIKPHCGLRLPPDRYCLTSCNYKLRAATQLKKLKRPMGESLLNKQFKPTIKTEKTIVKRPNPPQPITKVQMTPKPLFKFSQKPMSVKAEPGLKMELDDDLMDGGASSKRKREDDEFELIC